MKKKLMAGAITLLSVATLAACSNSSEGKDLISMKGDVITEHQFFEEVKNNPTAQQVLLNMTIQKVFEQQYGSEVTDKDVDDAVAEEQKKYGDSYNSVLHLRLVKLKSVPANWLNWQLRRLLRVS